MIYNFNTRGIIIYQQNYVRKVHNIINKSKNITYLNKFWNNCGLYREKKMWTIIFYGLIILIYFLLLKIFYYLHSNAFDSINIQSINLKY